MPDYRHVKFRLFAYPLASVGEYSEALVFMNSQL
jgi:hypothetical protein